MLVLAIQFAAAGAFIRMHPMSVLTTDILLSVSFGVLLYGIVHARQPMGNMIYSRLATEFASFSYTLYLVHLPCLTFLTALVLTPWHAWPKDGVHMIGAATLVCATYAYAWCLYLLFERNTDRVRSWIAMWGNDRRKAGDAVSVVV